MNQTEKRTSAMPTLPAPKHGALENEFHPYHFDYLEALDALHRADKRLAVAAARLAHSERYRASLARIKAKWEAEKLDKAMRSEGWFELRSVLKGGV